MSKKREIYALEFELCRFLVLVDSALRDVSAPLLPIRNGFNWTIESEDVVDDYVRPYYPGKRDFGFFDKKNRKLVTISPVDWDKHEKIKCFLTNFFSEDGGQKRSLGWRAREGQVFAPFAQTLPDHGKFVVHGVVKFTDPLCRAFDPPH
jgi:hypothetical protein